MIRRLKTDLMVMVAKLLLILSSLLVSKQNFGTSGKWTAVILCAIMAVFSTGCSTFPKDTYPTIPEATNQNLWDMYHGNKMLKSKLSFAEFAKEHGIEAIYTFDGDRRSALHFSTWAILADGYKIEDVERSGNRFFAIPSRTYEPPFAPTRIAFWVAAERGGRMYLLEPARASVRYFKKEFHPLKEKVTSKHEAAAPQIRGAR